MLTQELEEVQAEARHTMTGEHFRQKKRTCCLRRERSRGKAHNTKGQQEGQCARPLREVAQFLSWWVMGQKIKIYSKHKRKVMEWY